MATSNSTNPPLNSTDLNFVLVEEDALAVAVPYLVFDEITKDFTKLIGEGGFSKVYKGELPDGAPVAVKKLNEARVDADAFMRETTCLMKVKHTNIIRLLGYCGEKQAAITTETGELVNSNKVNMVLCFEYVPETLQKYIQDASTGLPWSERYQIIKGICAGLYYLHRENIVHLDLKPGNILLDKLQNGSMVPKITDFGLAKCFKEHKTHITATKHAGTEGYMAPEYKENKITTKYDLFSLGHILMEIMTGEKGHHKINDVHDPWVDRISDGSTEWDQIKVCAEIANLCIKSDPLERPSGMKAIVDRLDAAGSAYVIPPADRLLVVQPSVLRFPAKPSEITYCPLHLKNNTNKQVAFALTVQEGLYDSNRTTHGGSWWRQEDRNPKEFTVQVPLYGLLPPRSNYTLIVATKYKHFETRKRVISLVLGSTRLFGVQNSKTFHSKPDDFFKKAWEMNNVLSEELKVFYNPQQATITPPKQILPRFKIILKDPTDKGQYSLDANHSKQWIAIAEGYGHIRIWNYRTKRKVASLKVSKEIVTCVKFIAQNKWLVAGLGNGYVHVYNCEKQPKKITSFRATGKYIVSLAVHPTCPYLLLAYDREMKLLDWDKNWKCIQTFEEEHTDIMCHVTFNIKDSIVSASKDHTIKVWSLDSPKSICSLSGHSKKVNCLHFFTCDDQEYLVTGSDDCTAKIWDMQNKICIHILEVFVSPVMCVLYQANRRTLIIGSKGGCVYLWSMTNSGKISHSHRLERIINVGYPGPIHGIACLLGRIAIGKNDAVVIMDIDDVRGHEKSTDFTDQYLNAEQEDPTSTVTAGSSGDLLDIHPHELGISIGTFPSFLRLTNKTDENVAFRLIYRNQEANKEIKKASLYGIVPPRITYTLALTYHRLSLSESGPVVQSSTLSDKYMVPFTCHSECNVFFREAEEMKSDVHELSLRLAQVYAPETAPMMIKNVSHTGLVELDAHLTEPWITSCHNEGIVAKWKYDDSKCMEEATSKCIEHRHWKETRGIKLFSSSIPDTITITASVTCIKIIPRWQWIVVGTDDGFLHVYSCAGVKQMEKISSFRDHDNSDGTTSTSLAVHPTQPYVFSTSLKLWKWEENWKWEEKRKWQVNWKCTQTFSHVGPIRLVEFNPEDPNIFVTVPHGDHPIVQVWSLDSLDPNCTLSGHSGKVNCLEFIRQGDKQYLVTGSDDGTAKVWDLQITSCIHTLEAFMCPVTCVTSLSGPRPYILTGSQNGSVYVWRTTDFRLQRIVHYSLGGCVHGLVCLMASRRVVIGYKREISIMDVDEEEVDASQGANNENSDLHSYNSWLPGIFVGLVLISQLATWYSL